LSARFFSIGITLALVSSSQVNAQCSGFRIFPTPGAAVPANVQLVLEGVGDEQNRVLSFVGSDELSLVATGDEVKLKIEKGFVSSLGRAAIRLVPKQKLKVGSRYTLRGLGEGAKILNDTEGENKVRFVVGASDDRKPPKYLARPSVTGGEYSQDKNGKLVRRLLFRTSVEDEGAFFIVATVQRSKGSNLKQQYPVFPESGVFSLGTAGCDNNFSFDDGRNYKLVFELFDSAGNRGNEKATLDVAAPKPVDR
jgi:hypothetical protein